MGSVIRTKAIARALAIAAALIVAVPSLGHATTTTKTPAWDTGTSNQGADSSDQYVMDPSTGMMTLLRVGGSVNGSLGCAANGPFANFQTTYTSAGTITSVTVHYDNSLVDPYTWLHVGIMQDGHYIDSVDPRGPFEGSGDVTVDLTPHANISAPVTGTITIEFGINVASACPNVDGGTATFSSVAITEA